MELLTIRESSLGAYTKAVQDAVLAGYRMSEEPSKYPWNDTQFNAVFEEVKFVESAVEPSTEQQTSTEQPTKKLAGRPPRKL